MLIVALRDSITDSLDLRVLFTEPTSSFSLLTQASKVFISSLLDSSVLLAAVYLSWMSSASAVFSTKEVCGEHDRKRKIEKKIIMKEYGQVSYL